MKCFQKVTAIILTVVLLTALSGTSCFAEESRTLIWEDGYQNVDPVDSQAPPSFDMASDHGDLMVYANTNAAFDRKTLTMIKAPATKGYVVYDVSAVKFPEAQIEADVAFYADPSTISNYVTIWTSKDGTDFVQNSVKLLEDATDMGQGWFLCKVINFAAIPEGTKAIKIQLETPGQGWDVQLYSTAVYQIPAGDINLVAPVISLGEQTYPQQAAKDSTIQVFDATASDDVTPASELAVTYTATSPVGSLVTITDGKFVLGMYGDYIITYASMDQHGNMTKLSQTITAIDKADMPSDGIPAWVIALIVAVAVVIVAGIIFIVIRACLKKKKQPNKNHKCKF